MSSVNPLVEAENLLRGLAGVFDMATPGEVLDGSGKESPGVEERYRALVEQIPAVVFMADMERGAGQAYVSPQIEESLGFSQAEWLQDPVRWYQQLHPDDKERWSVEAAEILLEGKALRSVYRVVAKDGRTVWFQCEARMMRRADGRPWFLHGIAVDITDLKTAEAALAQERNVASAIVNAVGTLVVVLDSQMRIVRFNRVCEQTSGLSFDDVKNRFLWELLPQPEHTERFRQALEDVRAGLPALEFETEWGDRGRRPRVVSWAFTVLRGTDDKVQYFIATGADLTARRRLESALLEASSREQQRIGQNLHDGLGQLLTGIGFMSKALEHRLAEQQLPEAMDAAKIARHVNDAIRTARELAHGLMPISPEPDGLTTSLRQLAREVKDMFGVDCNFECGTPVVIRDPGAASHLYNIAKEAINNGIKHGQAKRIEIMLTGRDGQHSLVIHDAGRGMRGDRGDSPGMGLDIMEYRAKMIGGSLEITSSPQGTTVACHFPTD